MANRHRPIEHERCFKPTKDCWYPNFPDNQVRVTLHMFIPLFNKKGKFHNHMHRVSVWGADDCGMEKDFKQSELGQAKDLYNLLIQQPSIERKYLESLGFIPA